MGLSLKKGMLACLLCLPAVIFAQQGTTFKIEKLSKPDRPMPMHEDIWKWLILSDVGLVPSEAKANKLDFPFGIVAHSKTPDKLINFGYHAFFYGIYQAYADHRPLVLSPDMIWLLISQGFARHINANPETMRKYLVDFSGKERLTVLSDQIDIDDPDSRWETIFPEFTKQIAEKSNKEIVHLLSADFSTTTLTEKIASEITVMEAMKPYFEYVVMRVICGIPEITLKGTPEDWQKILDKTLQLGKYDLEWWTRELEPLLKQFVKASKGKVDKEFWRNIFKYHTAKTYGAPRIIDGWIVKFFPYDKKGRRSNLSELVKTDNLADEIVKVDVKYVDTETGKITPIELWAGFVGVDQNLENFALTPKIGWMIRKKDVTQTGLKQKLGIKNPDVIRFNNEIMIKGAFATGETFSHRDQEIPPLIFELNEIECLEIDFTGKIVIPDRLAGVKIGRLILSGAIDQTETEKISRLFPNTELIINNQTIHKP